MHVVPTISKTATNNRLGAAILGTRLGPARFSRTAIGRGARVLLRTLRDSESCTRMISLPFGGLLSFPSVHRWPLALPNLYGMGQRDGLVQGAGVGSVDGSNWAGMNTNGVL